MTENETSPLGSFGSIVDEMAALRPAQPEEGRNLDAILRIPITLQVVLGSATMPVANLLKLGRGAVVPLDHRVGEPVDVVVNGRVVARGEVVVVEDDTSRFGVSLDRGHQCDDGQRALSDVLSILSPSPKSRMSDPSKGRQRLPPCSSRWAGHWRVGS